MEPQTPALHKQFDRDHFIEMVLLSYTEDRIEYYPNGVIKRKLVLAFCHTEDQYCVLETNYNEDGSILDKEKGYAYRRIYDTKTVGFYPTTSKI